MSHNNNNNSQLLKHCVPVPNGRHLGRTRVSGDGIGAIDVFVIGNEPSLFLFSKLKEKEAGWTSRQALPQEISGNFHAMRA